MTEVKMARRDQSSVSVPRWVTIPFLLIIAGILWRGVLSDSSGLTNPSADSIVYVIAVICVAGLLAYLDRNKQA
jgi:hypothetical protein